MANNEMSKKDFDLLSAQYKEKYDKKCQREIDLLQKRVKLIYLPESEPIDIPQSSKPAKEKVIKQKPKAPVSSYMEGIQGSYVNQDIPESSRKKSDFRVNPPRIQVPIKQDKNGNIVTKGYVTEKSHKWADFRSREYVNYKNQCDEAGVKSAWSDFQTRSSFVWKQLSEEDKEDFALNGSGIDWLNL